MNWYKTLDIHTRINAKDCEDSIPNNESILGEQIERAIEIWEKLNK
jgi:hypothetical protein